MNRTLFIFTFGVAMLASLGLTPLIRRLAVSMGAVDKPNHRKVHSRPTPLWGGLGVFGGMIISIPLTLILFGHIEPLLTRRAISSFIGLLVAGVIIVILGLLDDRFTIGAKQKLSVQIVAALVMYYSGISITFINIPGQGYYYFASWISLFITVFWIVGIMNALNLLDGLDGLLSGVAVISGLIFFIVAVQKGQLLVAMLMMALVGGCLGFLHYNFHPASIFLGDTGSLLIGLTFAASSIMGALKTTTTLAFMVPVLIMGVPIFDTAFAIFRRFIRKKPIFSPDKDHVHHRLLRTGLSHRNVVFLIYLVNLILGILGIVLARMY